MKLERIGSVPGWGIVEGKEYELWASDSALEKFGEDECKQIGRSARLYLSSSDPENDAVALLRMIPGLELNLTIGSGDRKAKAVLFLGGECIFLVLDVLEPWKEERPVGCNGPSEKK